MIVSCSDCTGVTQVQHSEPAMTAPAYIRHCPLCGSPQVAVRQDLDGGGEWFAMSRATNLPVALLKDLYALWNPSEGDPNRFFDFLREQGLEV